MKTTVIFDFDWSLINEDSDTWIFSQLNPELLKEIRALWRDENGGFANQWNKLMAHMVNRLMTENGVCIESLYQALCSIPVFSEIIEAIQYAHEIGAILLILSDANTFYISVILKHFEIYDLFTKIVTNYAEINDVTGVLKIMPYQSFDNPHNCHICPPNLCKGSVLTSWKESSFIPTTPDSRIIYIVSDLMKKYASMSSYRNCFFDLFYLFPCRGMAGVTIAQVYVYKNTIRYSVEKILPYTRRS